MIVNGLNMDKLSSMVEVLASYAKIHPDRKLFTFLKDGKSDESVITFAELNDTAKAIAEQYLTHYKPGSRVLIVAPNGLEYIYSLFACFYARMIAVPVYPPTNPVLSKRLVSVIKDCQPSLALTTSKVLSDIRSSDFLSSTDEFFENEDNWLIVEQCNPADTKDLKNDFPCGSDIALLQYTSGSTGTPKGVMITHANLMANEKIICRVFLTGRDSVCVSWLPFHHDMGLVGCLLQTVYASMHCVFMDPYHFVREPLNWLKAISYYRGTVNGGPNFAFELLARRLKRSKEHRIDLSSWRTAFCGAEPIQAKTLDNFLSQSIQYGFSPKALSPCYGLAEATLIVSGCEADKGTKILNVSDKKLQQMQVKQVAENSPGARQIVSCGNLLFDQNLYILREESSQPCAENEIGEICVSGPNITRGYWNNRALTRKSFVTIEANEKKVYRTGDLGFMHDGHLYVSGRLKDLIIINGRNYFPQDIESSVWSANISLRHGSGASFSLEFEGKEQLIVVQEINNNSRNNRKQIARDISDKIFTDFYIRPYKVVLIKRGTITKTSSGKIQRSACKKMLKEQKLQIIHEELATPESLQKTFNEEQSIGIFEKHTDGTNLRKQLCLTISQCCDLPVQQVFAVNSIDRLGLDSILTMQLKSQLEDVFNVELELQQLIDNSGYDELLHLITESQPKSQQKDSGKRAIDTNSLSMCLTKSQESLWYLQNRSPQSSLYHISRAFNLNSPFDLANIESAFKKLQEIHPALNIIINVDDMGNVVQTFKQDDAVPVQIVSEKLDEKALNLSLNQWANKAFELYDEKLYRIVFFSNAEKPVLLFVFHHIICDFQSLAILYEDLSTILGDEVVARRERGNFTNFVDNQTQYSSSTKAEEDRKYWRAHLAQNPITRLNFFSGKKTRCSEKYRSRNKKLPISAILFKRLKAIKSKCQFSTYTLLLASLQAFIAQQLKQDVVAIGTALNQRNKSAFQSLFGYCVNPVPLVQQVEQSLTVIDFISKTERLINEALSHGSLPIAEIVEQQSSQNLLNRNGLFDVILTYLSVSEKLGGVLSDFALHAEDEVECTLGPVKLESRRIEEEYNQFPIELRLTESRNKLKAELIYREDLVHREFAEYLGDGWIQFLTWFCDNLQNPIADAVAQLDIEKVSTNCLTPIEKQIENFPSLHQLFERQCDDTPELVALSYKKNKIRYRQIEDYSNQIARYIFVTKCNSSVSGPALVVAAANVEVICVLIALSKAGVTFVCLSEEQPMERIQYVVQDCEPALIFLNSSSDKEAFKFLSDSISSSSKDAKIVDIESGSLKQLVKAESTNRLDLPISGKDIAYYAYTSGTTGKPKAIVHRHASLVSFIQWQAKAVQIENNVTVAQQASMGFDVALCEIFGALCFGASLALADSCVKKDPVQLMRQLADEKINVIQLVPSYFRQLAEIFFQSSDYLTTRDSFQLKNILFVGEALTADVVAMASKMFPCAKIHNVYGPTECVAATHNEVNSATATDPISIGEPIDERVIFLLNENNELCSEGEVGEICIGGSALSSGYLKLEELTKKSFCHLFSSDLPFSKRGKVFRSGDLGRFDFQGKLFVEGRKDNQVKVNGVRIELEEIDRNILTCGSIVEASTFIKKFDEGDIRLCACVVFRNHPENDAPGEINTQSKLLAELKEHLAKQIPASMIPSLYYSLPRLPRNLNSKVDRGALANNSSMKVLATFEQPLSSNRNEGDFIDVVKNVLKIDMVDVNSSFFDAGGNSLLAMRCINYINKNYGLDIRLQDITDAKSIESLALNLERKRLQVSRDNNKLVQEIIAEVIQLNPKQVKEKILELQS
ncbi:AMP-binding protein [Aliikangiella coralliicola]|uniref:AMP-binding protein n=1 Tax=Aliikangiella coralliicola TaxID=2592383 RepID=A0A545TV46_9GAMM|nr:AMP-binding protein [Aliikangiella coralliicola]TQV81090.1 AMP-binding protein [Aliikangiella coralliicola]